MNKQDFAKADEILILYNRNKNDQYGLQLHAQLLYWMKEIDRSITLYDESVKRFPNYPGLKLDYGRVLFELGKFKQSEEQLEAFLASEPGNVEANIMLSYLLLWQGNANAAREKIIQLKEQYPDNSSVQAVADNLNAYYTSDIALRYGYLSDDQPLTSNRLQLQANFIHSAAFSPFIAVSGNQFALPGNSVSTFWLRAGNTFRFGFSSTSINAEAGYFKGDENNSSLTWQLGIDQKISNSLQLNVAACKLPYQHTAASINEPFIYSLFSGSLQAGKQNKWLGRIGVEMQTFDDGNNVLTAYTWWLLPVIEQKAFSLKTGYGFSYANAEANVYTSAKPLNVVAGSQAPNTHVAGVYRYFTPQNQQVHSLLVSSRVSLAKNVQLNVRASFGVYATADNPVLILQRNIANQYSISKSFYLQKYTPVEAAADLQFLVSKKVSLKAKNNYSSLFFYKRNDASLQLNYRLVQ